jgi:hypothetical protein
MRELSIRLFKTEVPSSAWGMPVALDESLADADRARRPSRKLPDELLSVSRRTPKMLQSVPRGLACGAERPKGARGSREKTCTPNKIVATY